MHETVGLSKGRCHRGDDSKALVPLCLLCTGDRTVGVRLHVRIAGSIYHISARDDSTKKVKLWVVDRIFISRKR